MKHKLNKMPSPVSSLRKFVTPHFWNMIQVVMKDKI